MPELPKTIQEFLELPPGDPRLVPLAEELSRAVKKEIESDEILREYRRFEESTEPRVGYVFVEPNFPYVSHAV